MGTLARPNCNSFLPQWPEDPNASKSSNEPKKTKKGAKQAEAEPAPAVDCRDWSNLDLDMLEPLPPGRWIPTFEAAWRTVWARHYDPTLGCLNWPALRSEYGAQVASAQDATTAFEAMNAMLHRLGQSHLAVIPPAEVGENKPDLVPGPGVIPIRVRLLEDEFVITDAAAHGRSSGLPAGATLVAIEGHPVAALVDRLEKAHDRPVEVAAHAAAEVGHWLSCPVGAARTVTFRPLGSSQEQRSVVACLDPKVERVSMGNLRDLPLELEATKIPGTTVGRIRFNLWLLPLVSRIEASLSELRAKGIESLIIDLRGNPGGVGAMVVPIARLLLAEDASLGTLRTREMTYSFNVTATEDPFPGRVVILLDEGSASTSEIFAQALQDLGRAVVIASGYSQGAALPSLVESLPLGARIQFVVGDYTSPKGIRIEGHGIRPDLAVRERPSDFASGRDPVLDAAVLHLHS